MKQGSEEITAAKILSSCVEKIPREEKRGRESGDVQETDRELLNTQRDSKGAEGRRNLRSISY